MAINAGSGGDGLSALLPALPIRREMDAIQGAVVAPQVAIGEQRAARRQVFWNRPQRASRAQNIHDPVHLFAHVDVALVATALGRQEHRFDMRPFIVGHIARVSQFAAVATAAVFSPSPSLSLRA
jgi:hypothetical protein